jgi:DsbC/DsbD-like thiol-disulfide interchange protein
MARERGIPYFPCAMLLRHIIGRAVPCAVLVLGLGAVPSGVPAQSIVSTGESFVHAAMVAGRTDPDGTRVTGLVLEIAPGWKTYWRNPGAAGIPPKFDWSRSKNLASAEVEWPAPHQFNSFGLTTTGYSGRVVFPVKLVPKDPAKPVEVGLDLALGICRDICVLQETSLEARIDGSATGTGATLVAAAEATVPRPGAELGLKGATCRITGAGKKRRFDAELTFAHSLPDPVVLLEGPDLAWFGAAKTKVEPGGRMSVAADLSVLDDSVWVNRSDVRMTVLAGNVAADIKGCSAPAG